MDDGLDLSRLPKGQREWSAFIQALAQTDDRAERYFLELKSTFDVADKAHCSKVAKFILGAANRMPDMASRRFEGHALLVLGVSPGNVLGVASFEAKDLQAAVLRYIGAAGPRWDFEQVRGEGKDDVIVIIVDPPRQGDPVWTCMRDGADGLKNGGIYIRADGQTREAKGDEVRELLGRASRVTQTVDLDVQVLGLVSSVTCSDDPLADYVNREVDRLRRAALPRDTTTVGGMANLAALGGYTPTLFGTLPENRTPDEYSEQVDNWATAARAAQAKVVDALTGMLPTRNCLRITNGSKAFLEDVQVRVHLAGSVRAVEPIGSAENLRAVFPVPPRLWGPRKSNFGLDLLPNVPRFHGVSMGAVPGGVDFRNGGSVDLELHLPTLRPHEIHESDDDEFLLVLPGAGATVNGTWTVTARGIHDVFEGDLSIAVDENRDLSEAMRRLTRGEVDGDDEPPSTTRVPAS